MWESSFREDLPSTHFYPFDTYHFISSELRFMTVISWFWFRFFSHWLTVQTMWLFALCLLCYLFMKIGKGFGQLSSFFYVPLLSFSFNPFCFLSSTWKTCQVSRAPKWISGFRFKVGKANSESQQNLFILEDSEGQKSASRLVFPPAHDHLL